ncbi:hypothetical protein FGO68_gene5276 [Halteria grandinella]|uniref:Uncharacterized protein n=1 Tax=Halteria grandinella TaxID=5974 RepID=A0A8J8NZN0_HALGN|nr:hypothetical protein FGO68_gene5276 [Halteria grandinella]
MRNLWAIRITDRPRKESARPQKRFNSEKGVKRTPLTCPQISRVARLFMGSKIKNKQSQAAIRRISAQFLISITRYMRGLGLRVPNFAWALKPLHLGL